MVEFLARKLDLPECQPNTPKLELRAETFRVDSPNGETTFVFWNLVLPTLGFRDIHGFLGLWREFFGYGFKLGMGTTRFVFEISGWVSFHFEAGTAAHRVVTGLKRFCPF